MEEEEDEVEEGKEDDAEDEEMTRTSKKGIEEKGALKKMGRTMKRYSMRNMRRRNAEDSDEGISGREGGLRSRGGNRRRRWAKRVSINPG